MQKRSVGTCAVGFPKQICDFLVAPECDFTVFGGDVDTRKYLFALIGV